MGGKWDYWKPWVTSKTLVLPLSDTVHHTQQGLPIQQSCPCQLVCMFIYSVPIYALSYIVIIMYMYLPTVHSKREISTVYNNFFTLEKDVFYVRQTYSN